MMGRKHREQTSLFYEFRLEDMIPKGHLLRRINVFVTSVLCDLHEQLGPFYSDIGRPSIDPELLIRMLIIGYCFGIRSERKLCEEVRLHLAYRWFCRLDLNDAVPHHSTFSENRLNRFRESDILRHIFERVVIAAMEMGLVKGEGFAVDASVMEANASRYHGRHPMNSIGRRSSSESVRWLSILRHSKPKRRLKAMPRMTMRAVDPRAN
jgi:transposase